MSTNYIDSDIPFTFGIITNGQSDDDLTKIINSIEMSFLSKYLNHGKHRQ